MVLTEAQKYLLDATGFLRLPACFDAGTIDRVRGRIHSHLNGQQGLKFNFMHLDSSLFLDMMVNPTIMSVCNYVYGDYFRLDHAFGRMQTRKIQAANLHGGANASQGLQIWHWVGGKLHCGQLSVGVVLTPQLPEDGGFVYLPGSHKSQFSTPTREALAGMIGLESDQLVCPRLAAGDVIVFPESLVHGARKWLPMDRNRLNLYWMFMAGFSAWRPAAASQPLAAMARNDMERRILREASVGDYQDGTKFSGRNVWQEPVFCDRSDTGERASSEGHAGQPVDSAATNFGE